MKKLNYVAIFKHNWDFQTKSFPKLRYKFLTNVFYTVRMWFRWHFNHNEWLRLIEEHYPEWIKEE